jgi:7-carboxy-7-deazaguanine synthase
MKTNQQKPQKKVQFTGKYSVHSIFQTIQGEGPHSGIPAIFIRLAGCNLQCPLCDTTYQEQEILTVDNILTLVDAQTFNNCIRLVVVTGGEPFRQNLHPLVFSLLNWGYKVQVETNGTLFENLWEKIPADWTSSLTVVCSPKTGSVHPKLLPYITAWKYVVTEASLKDTVRGLPASALDHPASPHLFHVSINTPVERIYLQPADEQDPVKNKANLEAAIEVCIKHGYRLNVQLHKIIGVE